MKYLQRGFSAHKSGNLVQAFRDYNLHLQSYPRDHNAMQLLGMLEYKNSNYDQAIDWMLRSLELDSSQANVHNNIGNAYKHANKPSLAQKHYQLAIDHQNGYADAWVNLIRLHYESKQYSAVAELGDKATASGIQHTKVQRYIAMASRELGDVDYALTSFDRLLMTNSTDAATRMELALTLYATGHYDNAIEHYRTLLQQVEDYAVYHNFGNALNASGQWKEAIIAFKHALNLNPEYAPTYKNLTELYWEHGQTEDMFTHYQQALANGVTNLEIGIDYVEQHLRLNLLDEALTVSDAMVAISAENPDVLMQNGHVHKLRGEMGTAIKIQLSIDDQSLSVANRLRLIETSLEADRHEIVEQQLSKVLHENPQNQHALALLHTFMRVGFMNQQTTQIDTGNISLLKNDFHVHNAERFVFEYHIAPPEGMTLPAYCLKLADVLNSLHQNDVQPLEQTLQHGTQTFGNLFDNKHPLIAHLVAQFKGCIEKTKQSIESTCATLGNELYPGFSVCEAFDFAGSWSVKLDSSGYHSNHYHPMGWLSSAFYVSLPQEVETQDRQGWFQVGQPNLSLKQPMQPTKVVRPEVGKLVIFPSFLWHGTIPFTSQSKRLSVAFDVHKKS